MKFKAQIGTSTQLSKLLQTLERIAETCVVHLTPEMLQFGVAPEGKDSLQVCADVSQRAHFVDFMVQSKAENNRISFFVKTANLSRALRSCCQGDQGTGRFLKLTKKAGVPALSFDLQESASAVQVLHEVPIRIVSDPTETAAYTEPPLGGDSHAAVAVVFPSREFRGLKNTVERMRTVSDWATGGVGGASASEAPCAEASASVEVKKLLRVLTSLSSSDIRIQNAIVCVVPGAMVILKIYLVDETAHSFLIYYLPVMATPDD